MNKREFLKQSAIIGTGLASGLATVSAHSVNSNPGIGNSQDQSEKYSLPALPYAYDALEPHIDEATMRLHHDIHHAGYVKGLNQATENLQKALESGTFGLVKHWERELAFHGAGHFLHTLFWEIMGPKQGKRSQSLDQYINKSFGSFDNFKTAFIQATKSVEGSGWGILAYEPHADKLVVLQAEKHSNQSQWTSVPVLVCDVWEHAYYLKYQNKREAYINAFFEVINWNKVSELLAKHLG